MHWQRQPCGHAVRAITGWVSMKVLKGGGLITAVVDFLGTLLEFPLIFFSWNVVLQIHLLL